MYVYRYSIVDSARMYGILDTNINNVSKEIEMAGMGVYNMSACGV